ncbi:unnamed protein product [Brassica rapa subsp. trilocularis]
MVITHSLQHIYNRYDITLTLTLTLTLQQQTIASCSMMNSSTILFFYPPCKVEMKTITSFSLIVVSS